MKTTVLESECFTPECKGIEMVITHSSLITSSLAEVSRILPTSNSLQVSEAALVKKNWARENFSRIKCPRCEIGGIQARVVVGFHKLVYI